MQIISMVKLAENTVLRVSSAKNAVLSNKVIDSYSKAKFIGIIARGDSEFVEENKEVVKEIYEVLAK